MYAQNSRNQAYAEINLKPHSYVDLVIDPDLFWHVRWILGGSSTFPFYHERKVSGKLNNTSRK